VGLGSIRGWAASHRAGRKSVSPPGESGVLAIVVILNRTRKGIEPENRSLTRAAQLADAEIVDTFQGRAALAADQGVAISAHQRLRDRFGARRTIEIGARPGFGHAGYYATENMYEKNL